MTVSGQILMAVDTRAERDGIGLPPQARELRAALTAAGSGSGTGFHARAGTSEPAEVLAGARSLQDVADVEEVARVLEVSPEYVRRLCRGRDFETASKVAGRWHVDRLELDQWRQGRQEARRA